MQVETLHATSHLGFAKMSQETLHATSLPAIFCKEIHIIYHKI